MSQELLPSLLEHLGGQRDLVVGIQRALVAIPALGPDNGGQGEAEKAAWIMEWCAEAGLEVENLASPDTRVSSGERPNLIVRIPGRDTSRTLWVISHMDVVPPGDLSTWASDPYELRVEDDTIYGRGVEDDHLGLVASLLLARSLKEQDVTPDVTLGLMLVADEETGSAHGLGHLLNNHPELFGKNDMYLIPDYGCSDSSLVEVAEKSQLWIKCTVHGKQCHASTPDEGINSLVASAALILGIDGLEESFTATDALFEPDRSTFTPTRKDANVPNVNTVPGMDVFFVDCRVLPQYDLDAVLQAVRSLADDVEQKYGVRVDLETVQREQAADPTPVDAPIVAGLLQAIGEVYGVEPRALGIGGGTVAALLRRRGLQAAVWSTWVPNAHQPNERASIAAHLGDAKVMARMLFTV